MIFLAPRRQERQVVNRFFFLCGLCVFAGDTPNFGCGVAALRLRGEIRFSAFLISLAPRQVVI
jgi:hypothetical protein